MSDQIPLSIPSLKGNEWKYIKECLDTEWVSSAGKYVDKFEQDIAKYVGVKHAVACVNGTAALHVALRIVGVMPSDEVIVPTLTFIAPINTVRYLNAEPLFMDCDEYYNIDIEKTIAFIENETVFENGETKNKKTGSRISAIIPVHVFGNAVDIEPLLPICKERNIKIVEDASESLGTYYTSGELVNKYTGTVGDIGCYSFNGNKIITTGGGGMIVTDNQEYAERARYLTTQAKDDPTRYIHNEIGYNYRLTNIQAAMGVAQLEQLNDYTERKTNNYNKYRDYLNEISGLSLAGVPDYAKHNYWMYPLQIDTDVYPKDREKLMTYLNDNGVQTRPVWKLNHTQLPYQNDFNYDIDKAIQLTKNSLLLPSSVTLQEEQIEHIIELLKS
ncbi:MAG: LegC family aminotransferase [Candidatus Marinimicrobia bacterium]|nr:LegC family aminotransferase [Candidatus Neomarinimicrobiota bacterium]MCF7828758.1 LegC family aminotransferase [Candidatus Neomarinimicrobiota bacterium]MCF7880675.1 LegC family aminotransferase [Candidatus Neomarinimicrobiota bacterium]